MIVDLSLPFGHSVSNGISNKLASVSCSSRGHLSHTHLWMTPDPAPWAAGEGGLEAGLLHLQHQHLATSWERSAYVDRALPVGLRSALRNFTAVQI